MKYIITILLVLFFSMDVVAGDVTAADTVVVEVKGTNGDARFDPAVVKVEVGDVIQFVVREGWHTVTAYHPENRRPQRMPSQAASFDSGLMEQGDSWSLNIIEEGVYDYFCLPHENMGHVGRIIAGSVDAVSRYTDVGVAPIVSQKLEELTKEFLNQ